MALRTMGVKLTADVSGYIAGMRRATESTRSFTDSLNARAASGQLDAIADRAGVAGIALGAAFAYPVKAAMDFEKAMSSVDAATNTSAGNLNQLREAALQAGKDTQYSATQAAKGITELGKAGVATGDILNGGLKGALSLAAAGQIDVSEAAETAASAMTQFNLSGDKVPHVADLLAAAAGKAQGSVHDMGMALNQAGLVSAQTGLSIEETTGGLAAFANAGLIGSDAGTSFKQMLLMLQAPSGSTRKVMDELGISAYDAQGNFIGLANLAGQLKKQLAGLTPEARASAMATIFGADAVRGASILYEQGADGIQQWIGKVNDAGYAQETAAKLTDNLAGDVERLKGAIETMAIEAGGGAQGGLRVLVQGLNGLVDRFSALPPVISGTLTVMAGVGGVLLLAAAGWVKMRRAIAETSEELRATGPAGEKAAAGLNRTAQVAGRAAASFAALQVAGMAVSAAFGKDLNPQLDALGTGLTKFAQGGELSGEAARLLGGDMGKLDTALKDVADTGRWSSFARGFAGSVESMTNTGSVFDDSLTKSKERLTSLDQTLQQLAQGGNAQQAADIFKVISDRAREQGVSVAELKKALPGYAAFLETAATSGQNAAGGVNAATNAMNGAVAPTATAEEATKEYASAAEAAAAAATGQRDALVDLSNKMKAEADPVFGLIDAQRELKKAQDAAAAAVKKHGRNSDEAKEATQKLALAAINLQGKAGELGSAFDGQLTPAMRTTLKAAGLTEAQIADVGGQFRDARKDALAYDGKYKASVTVDGYGPAMGKLTDLLVAQQAAKKGISVSAARSAFNKNAFAEGGWTGPGSMWEPAGVVHADEFVIKKASRRRIEAEHPGMLDYANAHGALPPGYAAGGAVLPYPVNARSTKVISMAEALSKVTPSFSRGDWPSGPGAQRGDSGVWKQVLALIRSGPKMGSFGNAYRPGDPKWHGSGRAVDWMGYNMDDLATYLASKGPLELIHRTNRRDYAYTRGRNQGSFNEALMEAHRNHIHIAMRNGGVIGEHIVGVGKSGATYEFGENGPETVTPGYALGGLVNFAPRTNTTSAPTRGSKLDTVQAMFAAKDAVAALTQALKENGRVWDQNKAKGRENRSALIAGVKAAQDAARAKYSETGSVSAANKVYRSYIASLDNALKKMKVSAATRKALIRAYSEQPKYDLPDPVVRVPFNSSNRIAAKQGLIGAESALDSIKKAFAWTRPTFNAKTETGRAEYQELFSYLSAAETAAQSEFTSTGSKAKAMKIYNSFLAQLRALLIGRGTAAKNVDNLLSYYGKITLTPRENRWGGLYEHMAGGGLREAQIAAGGPTRYAWAESATGGELFAPKHGNLAKTRSQVGWAVQNWWGGNVSWGGQGSRGAQKMTIHAPISIQLGAETITRQVRLEVDAAVGEIATATVYQIA